MSKMSFMLDPSTPACDICSWTRTLIVFLFCRLGFDEIESGNLKVLQRLTESQFFIGGYTGQNNSAYYMTGYTGNGFVYLDPHYVQKHASKIDQDSFQSYQVKSIRVLESSKMIMSAGLGFLLHSFAEFEQFWAMMKSLSTNPEYKDSFFFCLEDFEDDYELDESV